MRRLGIWVWLLLGLGFILRLAIILKPFPQVDDLVLSDDSYLCWDIARRWAGGHPMTQDGIHFTNGFQPLWIFLLIPVYAIFPTDPFIPGKIALALLALFNVATGIFLFLLTREVASKKGAYFALFLWMASPYVIAQGINGMETALVILLMAITLWFYLTRVRDRPYSWQRFLGLGLLAGLTILARVDQAFLLLALGLDVLWQRRKQALAPLALMGLGALVMFSPWLFLSYYYTGSIVPVSGKAVHFCSLADARLKGIPDWKWNLKMLRSNLVPWVNSILPVMSAVRTVGSVFPIHRRIFYMGFTLLCGLGLWQLWRRTPLEIRERAGRLLFLWALAAGMLGLYAFYIYTWWFHDRYQAPVALLTTITYGILFAWSPRWGKQILWPLAMVLILPGLWKKGVEEPSPGGYHRIGAYVQETFPSGAKIGAYQSGAMGYFARNKVVINLDGVVNEEALRAHQEKRAFDYIREEGVEYLVNWEVHYWNMLAPHSAAPPSEQDLVKLWTVPGFTSWGHTWEVYKVVLKGNSP